MIYKIYPLLDEGGLGLLDEGPRVRARQSKYICILSVMTNQRKAKIAIINELELKPYL